MKLKIDAQRGIVRAYREDILNQVFGAPTAPRLPKIMTSHYVTGGVTSVHTGLSQQVTKLKIGVHRVHSRVLHTCLG